MTDNCLILTVRISVCECVFQKKLLLAQKQNIVEAFLSRATRRSIFEPQHEISNNVVCAKSKGLYQPVHTHSLIRVFASSLNILSLVSY